MVIFDKNQHLQNLKYITYLTEIIPFFFYLILAKSVNTKDKGIFFYYLFSVFILIILGFSFRYIFKSTEIYFILIRIYNLVEYCFLAYYFSLFVHNKAVKNFLLLSPLLFGSFCIYNFITATKAEIPFLPVTIEYLTLLAFIIFFLFEEMQRTNNEPIYQKAVFWISVAFILNFSGNFFLFLYSKNNFNDLVFQKNYTIIYSTVTVVKNIILCVSAHIYSKQKMTTKSNEHSSGLGFGPTANIKNPI